MFGSAPISHVISHSAGKKKARPLVAGAADRKKGSNGKARKTPRGTLKRKLMGVLRLIQPGPRPRRYPNRRPHPYAKAYPLLLPQTRLARGLLWIAHQGWRGGFDYHRRIVAQLGQVIR